MESTEPKLESHEQLISRIVAAHFNEAPKSINRITMGICNEVYDVKLSDVEIIARLNERDYFLKGSHYHIPMFKKMGIKVPDILAEDYSKKDIPFAYQFLSKLKGKDIGYVIEELSDKQLKSIAVELSSIFDKMATIPTNEKFGIVWGDFTEFSDTWTERMRLWVDETKRRGKSTGIMDDLMQSTLENIFSGYKKYFDGVKPATYIGDICSKNVMIYDGAFAGIVDLDGLTQGDPLEAIGRIKASWPGTHYGDVYTNAIMDNQRLDSQQRKIVLAYALLNRISWACENGIQFNQNTKAEVDLDRRTRDMETIKTLSEEYEALN